MRTASTDDARKLAAILLPETNGRNMTSHLRLVPEARATQCRSKLVWLVIIDAILDDLKPAMNVRTITNVNPTKSSCNAQPRTRGGAMGMRGRWQHVHAICSHVPSSWQPGQQHVTGQRVRLWRAAGEKEAPEATVPASAKPKVANQCYSTSHSPKSHQHIRCRTPIGTTISSDNSATGATRQADGPKSNPWQATIYEERKAAGPV